MTAAITLAVALALIGAWFVLIVTNCGEPLPPPPLNSTDLWTN